MRDSTIHWECEHRGRSKEPDLALSPPVAKRLAALLEQAMGEYLEASLGWPSMKNPGLPEHLWAVLDGLLWHATGPDGLKGILADGEIRIVGDRYGNSFCRQLGCVALLDFGRTAVDDWGQFNNWSGWFGDQQQARVAVWLEIDRRGAAENVIDAGALHQKWKKNLSKQIIPGVEAGHRGPVPVACIRNVLLIDRYERADARAPSGNRRGFPAQAGGVRTIPAASSRS